MPQGGGVGGKRNESSRSWPRRYGLCATVWRPLRTGTVSVHAQFAETWWARRGSNPHAAYAAKMGMLYPAPRGGPCRIGTVSVRVEPRVRPIAGYGQYSSAEEPVRAPPTTRTRPSASSVAV